MKTFASRGGGWCRNHLEKPSSSDLSGLQPHFRIYVKEMRQETADQGGFYYASL
jgi:hypothetical protein